MKDIVIIGAGGFGREIAWLIEDINNRNKEWNLLGFIDDNVEIHGDIINGYSVLGGFEFFKDNKEVYYTCAIGNSNVRKIIVESKCKPLGLKAATLIHPSVVMSNRFNNIGEGSIICASSIITVNVDIGRYSIINLDCTIGHDVILESYSTIYPSVNISGNCTISECTEIGTGTQIIQGKNIGSNSIIGAGSVVIRDINKDSVAVGIPAQVVKINGVRKL